jgi:glycosyltransferase involved in cell wall biosynthesis
VSAPPLVSVVVPAFDAERFLPATLRCVARQTYRVLEAVLWDDGSRDGTRRILSAWAPRLEAGGIRCTLGAHPDGANRGVSATRNAAIAAARGELIQLLDADDLLPGRKIAVHAAALAQDPRADVVYCDAYLFPGRRARRGSRGSGGPAAPSSRPSSATALRSVPRTRPSSGGASSTSWAASIPLSAAARIATS